MFCRVYRARDGARDEMVDEAGQVRGHWEHFVSLLDGVGREQLGVRWNQAQRLIHENGVTYNVYGDDRGMDRPWTLDALPLLIAHREWLELERALIQRASLLNLVIQDLYGEQRLIKDRHLPPEIIYENPRFLRACLGVRVPGGVWLHVYGADLGRDSSGRYVVIGDRAQAPSGAGYALENRVVMSRVLGEVFRECNVRRLALVFHQFRLALGALAPRSVENPRIVLLTPGPYNETYFEHAYLARYLGFALVQGADLTVRDSKVFLKTLGGLQRVDVILRRVDDEWCDMLELRGESLLGVPGLLEAVREGNVAVANALGCGAAQTPMLMPFLPGLCRALMGEDLLIDSVRSHWCGHADSLKYVQENLARLVIKPAFPLRSGEAVFGSRCTAVELEELAALIARHPTRFVAQEQLPVCTAPVMAGQGLDARHFVLRTFVWRSTEGYSVMPGGLTRFAATVDSQVVSMQHGGGSKDTWVLGEGPAGSFSLMEPQGKPLELTRGGGDLPSRIADNLFWLGRYVDRSEGLARLSRGTLLRLSESAGTGAAPEAPYLIRALLGATDDEVPEEVDAAQLERQVIALVFDPARVGSVRWTVQTLVGLGRILRDRLSSDTWRILQTVHEEFEGSSSRAAASVSSTVETLNRGIVGLAAFGGTVMDSMTRGVGWRFLDMGRRLERSNHIVHLLRSTVLHATQHENAVLEAVLEIADSTITYRRRYLTELQAAGVVDLLLADESNPRSVAYSLAAIEEHLAALSRDSSRALRSPEQRILLESLTKLRLTDLSLACAVDGQRQRPALEELLKELKEAIPGISDHISQNYLSHATVSRQLARFGSEGLP